MEARLTINMWAIRAASEANARLAEMLKACPVVYQCTGVGSDHSWFEANLSNDSDEVVYRALLANIEKLNSCEGE